MINEIKRLYNCQNVILIFKLTDIAQVCFNKAAFRESIVGFKQIYLILNNNHVK